MRIADFPLIFNDQEFPISWQNEYIRLLTTFEVSVIIAPLSPSRHHTTYFPTLSHHLHHHDVIRSPAGGRGAGGGGAADTLGPALGEAPLAVYHVPRNPGGWILGSRTFACCGNCCFGLTDSLCSDH